MMEQVALSAGRSGSECVEYSQYNILNILKGSQSCSQMKSHMIY